MKKLLMALLCVLLTLAMMVSLAACGEDAKKKSKRDDDDEKSDNGTTVTDARSVIDVYFDATARRDAKAYVNCLSPLAVDMWCDALDLDGKDDLIAYYADQVDEGDFLDIVLVSAEKKDKDECSLDEVLESASHMVGPEIQNADTIEDYAVFVVTYTIDGRQQSHNFSVIKVDGNWGLLN